MMPVPKTRRFTTIVCAVDLSAASAKALRYASRLADAAGGTVIAVLAIDPLRSAAAAAAYDSRTIEQESVRDLDRFVTRTLGAAAAARVKRVAAIGPAVRVLLAEARRHRDSVIVTATNARRGVRKFFFGSTTEGVLRRFRGAVLVVPPRARAKRGRWPAPGCRSCRRRRARGHGGPRPT